MTVEEAKELLDKMKEPYCEEENEALNMAISALEEIQEFRKENITIQRALDMMCDLTCATEIIEEFEAIGTVSEFRELKEKTTAKKITGISLTHEGRVGNCPNCKQFVLERYDIKCPKCKINLDWSEGKE